MKADIIGSELKITRDSGETIRCLLSNIAMIEFLINNEVQFHFKFGPNNSIKCKTSELYVNGVSSTKTDFETILSNNNIILGLEAVKTIEYELTRPNDNNDYAAGDVISNSTSNPSLILFQNMAKLTGKGIIITGIRIQTNDKVKFLGKRFKLHLYRDTSIVPIADNAIFELKYENSSKRVSPQFFTFPSVADGGATDSIATPIDGINMPFQLVGLDMAAQLQTLDAITAPVANAKIKIIIHYIQTN